MPICRLVTFFAFCLTLAQFSSASAQTNSAQTPQDQSQPLRTLQNFTQPGTIPSLSDILKNVHGSYAVSFMGPRLTGATNETYNIYLPDKAPIQLYHTFKLGYQVNEDLQIGIDQAIVNNVADRIYGFPYNSSGNPTTPQLYGKTFEYYDTNIYFDLPHLIKVEGWNVFTSASFSLPFT